MSKKESNHKPINAIKPAAPPAPPTIKDSGVLILANKIQIIIYESLFLGDK